MKSNQLRGKDGESYVAERLKKQGYKIVEKNYHSRYGEIDIIVRNKEYICFVEVKARNEDAIADPFYFVTKTKQRRIILTAERFLQTFHEPLQPRFDVASVTMKEDKIVGMQYIENAFY